MPATATCTLFQAICRTNRLDGADKEYGYIVDFKELFEQVQNSIAVYTSDELAIDEADGSDGNVIVKDWLKEGKRKLDEARESLRYLCEPVPLPRQMEQYLAYFCGDVNDPSALSASEPLRISFYKTTATFLRAYAAIVANLARLSPPTRALFPCKFSPGLISGMLLITLSRVCT